MIKTNQDSTWCLVGNVVAEHRVGEGKREIKRGTKHFSPGTKVYCMPAQWGDGYEKIKVIGRHRGSKQYVTMVIKVNLVTNWRAKAIYSPEVLRRLREPGWSQWQSQQQVEEYVIMMKVREEMQENHSHQDILTAVREAINNYQKEQLKRYWQDHTAEKFPKSLFDEKKYWFMDLYSLDGITKSCISRFLDNKGELDAPYLAILGLCYHDLSIVLNNIEGEGRDYFVRLETMSDIILRSIRDRLLDPNH